MSVVLGDDEGWISRSPEQNRALERESRNREQNRALEREEEKENLLEKKKLLEEKKENLEDQITKIKDNYETSDPLAQQHLDYLENLEKELDKTEAEILDLTRKLLEEKKKYLEDQITKIEDNYETWGPLAQPHLDYLEKELDKTEDEILDLDNRHASKQLKLYEKRENLTNKLNFFLQTRLTLVWNQYQVPPYLNRNIRRLRHQIESVNNKIEELRRKSGSTA